MEKPTVVCECGYDKLYDLIEGYVGDKSFEPFIATCPKCGKKFQAKKLLIATEEVTGNRMNTTIELTDVD